LSNGPAALSRRHVIAAWGGAGGALAAGTLGAACARPVREAPPAEPRVRPATAVTYWKSLSGPRHDAQVALVEDFHARRPDVTVTLEHAGEYSQAAEKLRVALAGGTAPDVAMLAVNTDLPAFARLRALQPLDSIARGAIDGFYPGFLRDCRVEGQLYALPFARSTPLLYLNADLLRGAGLPDTVPAGAPGTWPHFLDLCQRLVRARGGAPGAPSTSEIEALEGGPQRAQPAFAAYGVGTNWLEFQPLLWSFGGAYSDARMQPRIAEPASVEALQFLADLVHRHRVALATRAAQTEFVAGRIALLTVSSASLSQIEAEAHFRVLAAPLPVHRERGIPAGGSGLSLLRAAPPERRSAAWDLVQHLTSTASTSSFARATGYTPVRPAALREPLFQHHLSQHPNFRTALEQLAEVRPTDAVLSAPFANRAIEGALSRVLFDGVPPAQVCAALEEDFKRAVASMRA
jgi:sn-glycerol 3-phosphate transport system substrate-binding protein